MDPFLGERVSKLALYVNSTLLDRDNFQTMIMFVLVHANGKASTSASTVMARECGEVSPVVAAIALPKAFIGSVYLF